jgi:hypothetical protein
MAQSLAVPAPVIPPPTIITSYSLDIILRFRTHKFKEINGLHKDDATFFIEIWYIFWEACMLSKILE